MVSNAPDIRISIVFTQRENQNRQELFVFDKMWLKKLKKSRFGFLLWKKNQNNKIKQPKLWKTRFLKKKEERLCWKVGMRKCSKQLPKKNRGNDHLVIKSGNKVFLVLLNGLINPWKSAAGHIIRMRRSPVISGCVSLHPNIYTLFINWHLKHLF